MNKLFEIQNGNLVPAQKAQLPSESLVENWVTQNPTIVGLNAIVIGNQVKTDFGTTLDILALERNGSLVIIELKKGQTPRDVVTQALDYGSWACQLSTEEIYEIANTHLDKSLDDAYYDKWQSNIPEVLNESHSLLIVANATDSVTQRIVRYLAGYHGVDINTAFFNIFEADGKMWLTTDMLLIEEGTERRSKKRRDKSPWTGYYFTNVSMEEGAIWPDMKKHGFIGTNGNAMRVSQMESLTEGNEIFAYLKGHGYVGHGRVSRPLMKADQFVTSDGTTFSQQNSSEKLISMIDDVARPLFVVGVEWTLTFDAIEGKTCPDIFRNQHILCKLRDSGTIKFLKREFKLDAAEDE